MKLIELKYILWLIVPLSLSLKAHCLDIEYTQRDYCVLGSRYTQVLRIFDDTLISIGYFDDQGQSVNALPPHARPGKCPQQGCDTIITPFVSVDTVINPIAIRNTDNEFVKDFVNEGIICDFLSNYPDQSDNSLAIDGQLWEVEKIKKDIEKIKCGVEDLKRGMFQNSLLSVEWLFDVAIPKGAIIDSFWFRFRYDKDDPGLVNLLLINNQTKEILKTYAKVNAKSKIISNNIYYISTDAPPTLSNIEFYLPSNQYKDIKKITLVLLNDISQDVSIDGVEMHYAYHIPADTSIYCYSTPRPKKETPMCCPDIIDQSCYIVQEPCTISPTNNNVLITAPPANNNTCPVKYSRISYSNNKILWFNKSTATLSDTKPLNAQPCRGEGMQYDIIPVRNMTTRHTVRSKRNLWSVTITNQGEHPLIINTRTTIPVGKSKTITASDGDHIKEDIFIGTSSTDKPLNFKIETLRYE